MIEAAWIPFRLRSLHGPLCPDPHSYFQSICPIRIAVHAPGDPAGFRSVLLTVGYHEPVSVVCLSDLLHLAFYDQGLLPPLRGRLLLQDPLPDLQLHTAKAQKDTSGRCQSIPEPWSRLSM